MSARKSNVIQTVFLLLGILSVLAVYRLLFRDAIANNVRLSQISRQLEALPQPPHTTLVSSNAAVGLLAGNGNHCDYFVGAVYHSQSSEEVIHAHYKGRQFQNPVTGSPENWEITLLRNENSIRSTPLPYDFNHPEAWKLTSASYSTGTLYLVHAMRSYKANGDLRCH